VESEGASEELNPDLGDEFPIERELKRALKGNMQQLEEGLKFVEEERFVGFGFVDIVAQDKNGVTVVIELKKGEADHRDVRQVASYAGEISSRDGYSVRGMLIAYGFSPRCITAARIVRELELRRYGYHFNFEKVLQHENPSSHNIEKEYEKDSD
jgi:RecB family endonuclease NucS